MKTISNSIAGGGSLDSFVLHFVLTHHWYDETERGNKNIEYREMTPRWRWRIWENRDRVTHVRFSRGYASRTITFPVQKIDVGRCPIPGWVEKYYRIHFLQNVRDERPGTAGARGANQEGAQ